MVIANMEIASRLLWKYTGRDVEAEKFYSEFRLNNGRNLSSDRIHNLTVKATVLKAVERTLDDGVVFQGELRKLDLRDIAAQIIYLRKVEKIETYLPANAKKLRDLLIAYRNYGYMALMSKDELNQK